jgi:hypothetical protein
MLISDLVTWGTTVLHVRVGAICEIVHTPALAGAAAGQGRAADWHRRRVQPTSAVDRVVGRIIDALDLRCG